MKSILDKTEQLDALATSLDLEKAELRAHAAPFCFTHWHGQHAIASSMDCRDPQGRSALVQLANSDKAVTDEAAVTALVSEATAGAFHPAQSERRAHREGRGWCAFRRSFFCRSMSR